MILVIDISKQKAYKEILIIRCQKLAYTTFQLKYFGTRQVAICKIQIINTT